MYYHVVIETNEKVGKSGKNKQYFEFDKENLSEIEDRIIEPFLRKNDFQFNGYFLQAKDIKRIAVKETQQTSQALSEQYHNKNAASGMFVYVSTADLISSENYSKNITTSVFDRVKASLSMLPEPTAPKASHSNDFSKVFIVHGHDEAATLETARFVEKLGFSATILREQATGGNTIIENIEEHTNVGFAIVLYTPCDIGGSVGATVQKARARQNVVFEHGYLIGKLGRQRVCALVKEDTELPTDISGVVYIPLDIHGAWHVAVAKDLRKAGYPVDLNKIAWG